MVHIIDSEILIFGLSILHKMQGTLQMCHKTNSLSQNPPFTISLSHWKECNESLRINYSSSSLSDSSERSSKYDSIVSISLMRISSPESVVDLVDPK